MGKLPGICQLEKGIPPVPSAYTFIVHEGIVHTGINEQSESKLCENTDFSKFLLEI